MPGRQRAWTCYHQWMVQPGYESRSGGSHYQWKGDEASYSAIHQWLNRHWPRRGACERCATVGKTEWANLTGRYDRGDRSDWLELCLSCHRKMDRSDVDPVVAKWNREKTHCANGHEFDDANTYLSTRRRNGRVYKERQCRACHRDREERRRSRQAAL